MKLKKETYDDNTNKERTKQANLLPQIILEQREHLQELEEELKPHILGYTENSLQYRVAILIKK